MQRLLDFLKKYSYWFLFILLEGLSLFLLFRFNAYQKSVWFTSANAVSGKVLEWKSDIVAYTSLREVNKQLTDRVLALEQQNLSLRGLVVGGTDSSLVNLASQIKGYEFIPAEIVNASLRSKNNFITIDKGTLDGVQPEMGVVSGVGVVGIVYATSPHYSIVLPVLNGKSNISCQLKGTNYFGYLRWDGRDSKHANMEDVPRHAQIEIGTEVETSGFSAVFPQGIRIGNVVDVKNTTDGQSYILQVNLSTDFACLRDVYVVKSLNHKEIKELQQKIEK